MLFYPLLLLGSIIFLDLSLSGDNAVVVAMAANGLKTELRDKAIFFGMMLAAGLRMLCALVATSLLNIHGIAFLGGIALFWVAYKLLREMMSKEDSSTESVSTSTTVKSALLTIVIADISMSIDNVLAVAALARHHPFIMCLGIGASILMLGFLASRIAKLLQRWPWLNWVGLALIVWVAVDLLSGSYNSAMMIVRQ